MDGIAEWFERVGALIVKNLSDLADYVPVLIGAIVILIIGWAVAALVRWMVARGADILDRAMVRVLPSRGAARVHISESGGRLLGNIAFWLVILLFINVAAKVADLAEFSVWIDRIVNYIPVLIVAGLILIAGYVASMVARDVTATTIYSAGGAHADLIGRAVQGAIIFAAVIIGIDQAGVDVTFLITIVAITVAAILFGLSFAFAFGARSLVTNLIGSHYIRQTVHSGQTVRTAGFEGEVIELTPVSIILATDDGRTVIPAKTYIEEPTTILTPGAEDG